MNPELAKLLQEMKNESFREGYNKGWYDCARTKALADQESLINEAMEQAKSGGFWKACDVLERIKG